MTRRPSGPSLRRHTRAVAWLLCACVSSLPASAGAQPIAPEALRADLHALSSTLAQAHYDLFAHRSRTDYRHFERRLVRSIKRPVTRLEAAKLLQRFAAYGRFGHLRIDAAIGEFQAYRAAGGTILPLFVRIDGGRVFLTETAERSGRLRAGVELLSVNGDPMVTWLTRLGQHVSAERPYMAHAQMETMLPVLWWLELGPVAAVDVEARTPAGEHLRVRVHAVTRQQGAELDAAWPTPTLATDFGAREVRLLPDGVAYLRPGPFYSLETAAGAPEPSYDDSAFRTFLDEAFGRILDGGARDLLLDLRNNPGGDNSFSDPMVAWFASRPFRFASRFMLKASAATKAYYARKRVGDGAADAVLARLMQAEAAQPNGARYAFDIAQVEPRAGRRFEGRVHVLVNRHSYSNAASVAALVQDYCFGDVLGEETADVPTSYASVVNFELPRTGFVVTYPKSYFVRPNGDERLLGVAPDHVLAPPPLADAEDAVLTEALRTITRLRTGLPAGHGRTCVGKTALAR